MTRGPTWSGGISGSVPASTTSVTPPSWSRAGPYPVSCSQLLIAAPVPRPPALLDGHQHPMPAHPAPRDGLSGPSRHIRRVASCRSRAAHRGGSGAAGRRLHSAARGHHLWRWRGPVTALVADPVDDSAQVPGGVDMDDDNLTRVDPDAEDRVRLVTQRLAQAVEDIGVHRCTLPFRARPGHPGRPGTEVAGRLGMNRVVGRLGDLSLRAGILHAGGPAAAPPRDGRALPDLVLRTGRGGPVPRGLLAVLRGVVLDEAVDELVDGAGLGQAALAGLVGQLALGQALVALAGLVPGLLGLLPLDPRGLPGLLPLGLLG